MAKEKDPSLRCRLSVVEGDREWVTSYNILELTPMMLEYRQREGSNLQEQLISIGAWRVV